MFVPYAALKRHHPTTALLRTGRGMEMMLGVGGGVGEGGQYKRQPSWRMDIHWR